jgi:thioredoxin reductase
MTGAATGFDGAVRLIVVGAGPAGMAGAVHAADAGLTVTVLDSGQQAGGQFYRQPAAQLRARAPEQLHHAWRAWLALKSQFDRHVTMGRIRHLADHHVWLAQRVDGGFRVHALLGPQQQRSVTVDAHALLLATGAYEQVLPFPGWTLPGVVTAGGAQALLKGALVLPGREVVVAGTGPLLLPVAVGLAEAGAEVKALAEAADLSSGRRALPAVALHPEMIAQGAGYAARLARHRVTVHYRHAIVAAHGHDRVESVTIAALDSDGRTRPNTEKRIGCDCLAVSHGLLPHLDLALTLGAAVTDAAEPAVRVDDEQRTGVPGLWAAGEATAVGGAALALVEGEIAGRSIAAWSRGPRRAWQDEDHVRPAAWAAAQRRRRRLGRSAAALAGLYASPVAWSEQVPDDTVICRCEEVPAAAVRAAVREYGATDLRSVKLMTRSGMGWCQGRMCGPAVSGLLGNCLPGQVRAQDREGGVAAGAVPSRPFARPVPLSALAVLDDVAVQEDRTDE